MDVTIMDHAGDIAVLAALAVVGYALVKLERNRAKDKKETEDSVAAAKRSIKDAKRELLDIVAEAREESERLYEATRKAESLNASTAAARASLTIEASRATRVLDELEVAAGVADRTCVRLSGLVSSAAEACRQLAPDTGEDFIHDEPADEPAKSHTKHSRKRNRARGAVDNVIQLVREAK